MRAYSLELGSNALPNYSPITVVRRPGTPRAYGDGDGFNGGGSYDLISSSVMAEHQQPPAPPSSALYLLGRGASERHYGRRRDGWVRQAAARGRDW